MHSLTPTFVSGRATGLLTVAAAGVLLSSCVSWRRQAQRYTDLAPTRYVIVHPEGREKWPEVQEFMAYKREQGLLVELLSFDPGGTPAERFARVALALKELRAPDGQSAFLLILATHEELPMGPWAVAGARDGVLSDLPLLAGHAKLGGRLRDRNWRSAVAFPPPWVAGRLPWDRQAIVAAALAGASELRENRTRRAALLGTERFALPHDSSLIMAGVRDDLERDGWETRLYGEDSPSDHSLDKIVANKTKTDKEGNEVHSEQLYLSFLTRWVREAPELVYVISHASLLRAQESADSVNPGATLEFIGAGRKLIEPFAFMTWVTSNVHEKLEVPKAPASPALLLTTGCQTGDPRNPLLGVLVRRGWASAICTSTCENGPLPPFAAIRAERCVPRYLSEGLAVGLAIHAAANAYLQDSLLDPLAWILSPWSWNTRSVNVLSYVIYGDPSLAITRVRAPRP